MDNITSNISGDDNGSSQVPDSQFFPTQQLRTGSLLPKAAQITQPTNKPSRTPRVNWTAEMIKAMLETLRAQAVKEKRSDGGWKSDAWTATRDAVIVASWEKAELSVEQVKSKLDSLKMLWKEWVSLSKQSGFGFNNKIKLFEVADYV